jgi:hypothetical protein
MRRVLCGIVTAALVLLAGCGGDEESTGRDDESRESSTDSGEQSNEVTVSLPDEFPDDVPIYPGATATVAMKIPQGFTVVHQTSAGINEAKEFFETELADNGWEVEQTVATPQGSMLSAKKDDRQVNIIVGTQDEQTTISTNVVEPM